MPTKREKLTAEHRKRISEGLKGKKLSQETKENIRIKAKERIVSAETRKKMSDSKKGRIVTVETRKKLSEAAKRRGFGLDRPGPTLGRKHTDEAKKKMSKIMMGNQHGKGIHYDEKTRKKFGAKKKGKNKFVDLYGIWKKYGDFSYNEIRESDIKLPSELY